MHTPPLQILFVKSVLLRAAQHIFTKQMFSSLLLFFSVFLSKQYLQRYVLCIDPYQKESFKSMLILNCQATEKRHNYKMLVVDGFCVFY